MDLFELHQHYQVLICRECQYYDQIYVYLFALPAEYLARAQTSALIRSLFQR
jgi:hypothetical protein